MYTIDDVERMLNEIAEELPEDFFKRLNGGVILLPDYKLHPMSAGSDLYTLGDYSSSREMGRGIRIYYGSFMRVHGHLPEAQFREKLRGTLLHEFTHHLESLAGERGLEIKDKIELEEYRQSYCDE